jgi:mannose/cellobiose epimerase-like protein (N-acyl-D-glucosamine 2-epimerase family)
MPKIVTIKPAAPPDDILGWLDGTCLPLWATQGVNSTHGSFTERLDADGKPNGDNYTRLRVQARQLFVFSHAFQLTGNPRWADVARTGFGFLTAHGFNPETGGWVHMMAPDGKVLDARHDAYDLAFVLLALAAYHNAVDHKAAQPWIEKSLTFLEHNLTAPTHDGYAEERLPTGKTGELAPPTTLPRRQNPHMHLLEAFIALHEATGEGRFIDLAESMYGLLTTAFFDADTGSLAEFFTEDWQPAPGRDGNLREPGHHFEWVWLLHRYASLTGDSQALHYAAKLYRWACEHGLRSGADDNCLLAIDGVDISDHSATRSARLWPQTEMIKAGLIRYAEQKEAKGLELAQAGMNSLFTHYISRAQGGWCDQIGPDNEPRSETMPASSLYHIMVAFSEWHRLHHD